MPQVMSSESVPGASASRVCLTRGMPDSAVQVKRPSRLPRAAVGLCLLSVLPYVGLVLADPEHISNYGVSSVPRAILFIVLVITQVAAVMMTVRFPYWVLVIVAAADLIILIASDQSGLGSAAVIVVIWYLVRYRIPGWQVALFANVIVFNVAFLIGEVYSGQRGIIAIIILLLAHLIQRYLLPVAVAEHMLGREQLHQALRDKAVAMPWPAISMTSLATTSQASSSAPRRPRPCGTRTRSVPTRCSRRCRTAPEPLWPICARSSVSCAVRTAVTLSAKDGLWAVVRVSRRRRAPGRQSSRRL